MPLEARRLSVHIDFSQLLFGGLSDRDLDVLEAHTQAGGDIFFEFNSFCDPTPSTVRQRAENLVGLGWTGWSGRYLKDPHDPEDTPHWLPRLYRQQYPGQELPHQPSLLLAHRDSRVFLITSENSEEILPTLNLRPEMSERFALLSSGRVRSEQASPYKYSLSLLYWLAWRPPSPLSLDPKWRWWRACGTERLVNASTDTKHCLVINSEREKKLLDRWSLFPHAIF